MGLFSDSPNKIFGTLFRQSRTMLRFGFDLGTDVFGFCVVFWYHSNSVMNREETKMCPVYMGSRFGSFYVLLLEKKNNMLLCIKIMFIYTCMMY